jgi:1-acyl-sn-glycerol-3-phosphate acyltransferase
MIAAGVRREHARPRPVHFAAQRYLGQTPGLDMLLVKAGVVTAHPANLHRLLFDEGQLVLAFPEGAHAQPLRARYRVREFSRADLLGAALRARAPIVPVAVLGSEEAAPVVGGPPLRGPLRRLASWALARPALSLPVALPAKVRLRFLAPVDPAQWPAAGGEDEAIRGLGDELRALIQDNLFEMVAQRRSVWLG